MEQQYKGQISLLENCELTIENFSKFDDAINSGFSNVSKEIEKTDTYLEFIVTQINKNVKIHVSYFSKSDRMRISWFKRKHNLRNLDVEKIERIMQSHS